MSDMRGPRGRVVVLTRKGRSLRNGCGEQIEWSRGVGEHAWGLAKSVPRQASGEPGCCSLPDVEEGPSSGEMYIHTYIDSRYKYGRDWDRGTRGCSCQARSNSSGLGGETMTFGKSHKYVGGSEDV